MTDVFISYASDDREAARKVSEVLSAKGWSVWWADNPNRETMGQRHRGAPGVCQLRRSTLVKGLSRFFLG